MGVDGDRSKLSDDLEPLNLFIVYAVRIEVLRSFGMSDKNISEIKKLYGFMESQTGTIREKNDGSTSLNHDFASFAVTAVI